MQILKGTPIASGIAHGMVCCYLTISEETLPHYTLSPGDVPQEIERFRSALNRAQEEMRQMIRVTEASKDSKAADIFNAHLLILGDEGLSSKVIEFITTKFVNAEHAVNDAFEEHISRYGALEGHFKELTHDFVDTRDRILQAFGHDAGHFKCDIGSRNAVVIATKRLTPSMVLTIPRGRVLAFVAEEGGITSHATILARSHNVPIVFGVPVGAELDCGMSVVVDGSRGEVVIDPDKKTTDYYDKKIDSVARKKSECLIAGDAAAATKSGKRITLKINLSTPDDLALAHDLPHDGVGLLRTEFLFMQKDREPNEDEQVRTYQSILDAFKNKPVTVRLLDISSDKLPPFLRLPEGINADMELRGAMAVEVFPDLYITQVKAILRANTHGNARLLYPMVSDIGDLKTFRAIVRQAKALLSHEKKTFNSTFTEGIMVETPAAVLMIDQLLKVVDFINIGSNDLLQYTLAASRGNALAEARYHILHPAVVKLLLMTAAAGRRAKKEVCLCGEIASFEEFYPLLLDAGISSFSVSPAKFGDIKCDLMHQNIPRGRKLLTDYCAAKSKHDADKFFTQFL
ncbi:MAG: phosphoenolpyruvate--protein phosphotransferase [Endomicrobiales bacterium]|jgi:phosphotransferase system enzyme I (PtsI)